MAPLQAIANSRTPPPARLRQWFSTLRQTKRDNVLGEPELFATYSALAAEAGDAIAEHKGRMQQQIAPHHSDRVDRGARSAQRRAGKDGDMTGQHRGSREH